MQWLTTTSCAPTASIDFLVGPLALPVMEGAPSDVGTHDLAGFSLNLSSTQITCWQISCPVLVDERLVMSWDSSTTPKPTVTDLMNATSRAVSLISVLTSKARLMAEHDSNLALKVSLVLAERSFVQREAVMCERLVCSTKYFFSGLVCSVNIVKQFLMNSPSPKGFSSYAIGSHNLKLSPTASSESFL